MSSRIIARTARPPSSHLRQVSTGSSNGALDVNVAASGTALYLQNPQAGQSQWAGPLGIFDNKFSAENVLLDISLFPKDAVKVGDRIRIAELGPVPASSHAENFQPWNQNPGENKDTQNQLKNRAGVDHSDRSSSKGYVGSRIPHGERESADVTKKFYVYIVTDSTFELSSKHLNAQVQSLLNQRSRTLLTCLLNLDLPKPAHCVCSWLQPPKPGQALKGRLPSSAKASALSSAMLSSYR